jgi:hypothetical protein
MKIRVAITHSGNHLQSSLKYPILKLKIACKYCFLNLNLVALNLYYWIHHIIGQSLILYLKEIRALEVSPKIINFLLVYFLY